MRRKERTITIGIIDEILSRKYMDRYDKKPFEQLKTILKYDEYRYLRKKKNIKKYPLEEYYDKIKKGEILNETKN